MRSFFIAWLVWREQEWRREAGGVGSWHLSELN